MTDRKKLRWGCLVVLLVIAAFVLGVLAVPTWFGAVEWDVTWATPLVAGTLAQWTGWDVQIRRLWLTPWQGLRMEDCFIQPSGGGRIHVRMLTVRYRVLDFLQKRVASHWDARQISIDPGSWKIRRPRAAEMLSAGPIVERLTLRVSVDRGRVIVSHMRAKGWAMRFHGGGQWVRANGPAKAGRQGSAPDEVVMRCWVRGQVASSVLEAMGIRKVQGTWEPVRVHLEGPVRRPTLTFKARFLTLTIGQGEMA